LLFTENRKTESHKYFKLDINDKEHAKMSLSKLEQTAALRILVLLKKREKASRTQLRQQIDASIDAIYNAIAKLKDLGLINESGREKFPFTVEVSLTEKGRKVAELVANLEKVLG